MNLKFIQLSQDTCQKHGKRLNPLDDYMVYGILNNIARNLKRKLAGGRLIE